MNARDVEAVVQILVLHALPNVDQTAQEIAAAVVVNAMAVMAVILLVSVTVPIHVRKHVVQFVQDNVMVALVVPVVIRDVKIPVQ